MASFAFITALLLLAGLQSSCATILGKSMDEFDLPSGQEWMSLSKSVDFMPAQAQDSPLLRNAQKRLLNYYNEDFVDGQETQYNAYAQAWRYLGLYVDCDQAANDGTMCKRYLLWAAYVDLNYEGNGLSEYMIYNETTSSWDKRACKAGDSKRCVKMDCHMKGTSYKTLGFFREDYPVEFLQVLAEHQGTCSFSVGQAYAMADAVDWLPQKCTVTKVQVGSSYIYFDLKPTSNGGLDVGLYTDADCSMELTGTNTTAQNVLTAYYGYDVALQMNLANINSALDDFKVCTPCRTFNLSDTAVAAAANDDAVKNQDPNNLDFVCHDEAGYSGVNQCMLFATTTQISAAPVREVALASQQGTVTSTYVSVASNETWWQAWGFFLISLIVFLLGLVCFCSVAVKRKRIASYNKNEPLIAKQ